jgi:predicted Zn-dependent protease
MKISKKIYLFGFAFLVVMFGAIALFVLSDKGDQQPVEAMDASPAAKLMASAAKDWPAVDATLNSLMASHNIDSAITQVNGFLAKYPDFIPAMERNSECYMLKGDYAKSEELLKKLETREPNSSILQQIYARLCLEQKDFESARRRGTKSLELAKDDREKAFAYCTLANAYIGLNDLSTAKTNIDKAIALDANNSFFKEISDKISRGGK